VRYYSVHAYVSVHTCVCATPYIQSECVCARARNLGDKNYWPHHFGDDHSLSTHTQTAEDSTHGTTVIFLLLFASFVVSIYIYCGRCIYISPLVA
jgi:hypothetical protein